MEYSLSFADVVKAIFIPPDPVLLLIIVGVPLLLIGQSVYYLKKGQKNTGKLLLIFVPVLLAVMIFLAPAPQRGAGWRIEGEKLMLYAPSLKTIDIRNASAALVDSAGPWRPSFRTNGYGTPGLGTGHFSLNNGKIAVVFRHLRSPHMVILISGDNYYVISHPGVEKLYEELIRRGIKQAAP